MRIMSVFTEFEEGIAFDNDDPDFDHHPRIHHGHPNLVPVAKVSQGLSRLSVGSVSPAGSEDEIGGGGGLEPGVVTLEELRVQLHSCFTCGVCWDEDHVSLDCAECGGYGLSRPCPTCDGRCSATWTRDLPRSHAASKARWRGSCQLTNLSQVPQVPSKMAAATS